MEDGALDVAPITRYPIIMARIVIVGCAGAGKTCLARQLGERTGAPVISLDDIWQSHWQERDVPAFRALLEKAHAGEEWISDGNFAIATFDIRLPRATLVIWLEPSRLSCAWRAITRVFKRGEAHRMGKLLEVLAFIWRFDRVNRPRIEALRVAHGSGVAVRRLNGSRDVAAFLSAYGAGAHRRVSTDPLLRFIIFAIFARTRLDFNEDAPG
jgi:adenylate kinase family enzyme